MNAKINRASISVAGCVVLGAMMLALPSCAQTGPGKTQSSLLQVGPIQLSGVLNNDTMAVGGEATGWTLDRGDLGPIDVDVSKVATQAAQLAGKRVAIAGQIIVRSWPIRGEVKTLVANSVMAQTRGDAGPMDIPPAPRPGK